MFLSKTLWSSGRDCDGEAVFSLCSTTFDCKSMRREFASSLLKLSYTTPAAHYYKVGIHSWCKCYLNVLFLTAANSQASSAQTKK